MKKLFAILVIGATLAACNDTETSISTDTDSLRAAATADSINAANALQADTTMRHGDTGLHPIDSLKK